MSKKNKWLQLSGLDLFIIGIIVLIFLVINWDESLGNWIKAAVYAFPIMMIYWIVGRIVQGRSDGPRGV